MYVYNVYRVRDNQREATLIILIRVLGLKRWTTRALKLRRQRRSKVPTMGDATARYPPVLTSLFTAFSCTQAHRRLRFHYPASYADFERTLERIIAITVPSKRYRHYHFPRRGFALKFCYWPRSCYSFSSVSRWRFTVDDVYLLLRIQKLRGTRFDIFVGSCKNGGNVTKVSFTLFMYLVIST